MVIVYMYTFGGGFFRGAKNPVTTPYFGIFEKMKMGKKREDISEKVWYTVSVKS